MLVSREQEDYEMNQSRGTPMYEDQVQRAGRFMPSIGKFVFETTIWDCRPVRHHRLSFLHDIVERLE